MKHSLIYGSLWLLLSVLLVSLAGAVTTSKNFSFSVYPASSTCPADDGSAGAPAGVSPQYPNLLNGNGTVSYVKTIHELGCKVAGVDYGVGPAAATTYTSWTTAFAGNPAFEVLGWVVKCWGPGAVVVDGVDFTTGSGAYFYVPTTGCSSVTIKNSKFGGAATEASVAYVFNQNSSSVMTVVNNIFDGTGSGSNFNAPGQAVTGGLFTTVEYNYFYHLPCRVTEAVGGTLMFTYNVIYDIATLNSDPSQGNCHLNYLQVAGIGNDVTIMFNVSRQASLPGGGAGEGYQIEGYGTSAGTFTNVHVQYNTMIAVPGGGPSPSVSNLIHGLCHTPAECPAVVLPQITGVGVIDNNYFDTTSAFNAFYPSSGHPEMWGELHLSNNSNMTDGSAVTNNP